MHALTKDGEPTFVSANQHVSMNMFGLPVSFLDELERGFPGFLANVKEGDPEVDRRGSVSGEVVLMIDECPAMKPGVGLPVLEIAGSFFEEWLRKHNVKKYIQTN